MSKNQALLEIKRTDFNEQQQAILRRLHLEALPDHETHTLALECIQIPDEAHLRVPGSLVQSIGRFGVLQAPSVVCCNLPPSEVEGQVLYEVIAGRRRTKGARLAGLSMMKCEVYASSTPQLSALLALIENTQRSSAWIKEVADLRLLISQHVGMTVPELITCGFARQGLVERLKIAQLPEPLLDQIVAGLVPLTVVRKLVRLTGDQLQRVSQDAQNAPLTAELVEQAITVQMSNHLTHEQHVLPTWHAPFDAGEMTNLWTLEVEPSAESQPSLHDVIDVLHAFVQSDAYHRIADIHLLVQALIQRLQAAEHTCSESLPHEH